MLALKILKGPTKVGQQISIDGNAAKTIGRASDADFQLPSNGVSKKHCQIREMPGSRLEIVDLGSSNGTFVNGLMIKKHLAKPGDMITLHDFVLKVEVKAPTLITPSMGFGGIGIAPGDFSSSAAGAEAPPPDAAPKVKQKNFFERTVFPLADHIGRQADVRFLVFGFFILWSIAIASLSIFPFSDTSNIRIEEQASEVAKLYARQLARVNESFVKEYEYQRLVHNLDLRVGQTPGVLSSMIIDANNGQILAPPELVGRSIANPDTVAGMEVLKRLQDENGYAKVDSRGIIHALAPIRVGVSDPNNAGAIVSKVVAVSYVEMDATRANLKAADLVDGALSAVIFAFLIGFLFIAMVYRWTEGSLVVLSEKLEDIINSKSSNVTVEAEWQTLVRIGNQINTIASRSGNGSPIGEEKSLEWAMATVESLPVAAAAFDEKLIVVSWNALMENIIGIRASMALGNDISAASRDVAFEGAIRDLSARAFTEPGMPQRKKLDFSGREHEISLVYSEGAHLVTIVLAEEDG
jgi:PAS domain-containing protein